MFADNLKKIRKEKGYTQEELAIKINVVRQTISKYEKGLSVPDTDILLRIADTLEVDVSDLLGASIKLNDNKNELAMQLAKISEQLAIKNHRFKSILKIIACIILLIFILVMICLLLYSNIHAQSYN